MVEDIYGNQEVIIKKFSNLNTLKQEKEFVSLDCLEQQLIDEELLEPWYLVLMNNGGSIYSCGSRLEFLEDTILDHLN